MRITSNVLFWWPWWVYTLQACFTTSALSGNVSGMQTASFHCWWGLYCLTGVRVQIQVHPPATWLKTSLICLQKWEIVFVFGFYSVKDIDTLKSFICHRGPQHTRKETTNWGKEKNRILCFDTTKAVHLVILNTFHAFVFSILFVFSRAGDLLPPMFQTNQ